VWDVVGREVWRLTAGPLVCALMPVREGLLGTAAVLSFTRVWGSTVTPPEPHVSSGSRAVTPVAPAGPGRLLH